MLERGLCRDASFAGDVFKGGSISCLLNSRIGHPFGEEIDKLFGSQADQTVFVLVSLVVAHSHDQFGRLNDFIPDNGFIAVVQLAQVVQHLRGRQVNATAPRASNGLQWVQWTVGSVAVQLAERHVDDAASVGKVAADCQLADEGANELGSRSNVILADFIAASRAGGEGVHGRFEPPFDAVLAVQVATFRYFIGILEHAEADAADNFIVDFALETVQIVAHGEVGRGEV